MANSLTKQLRRILPLRTIVRVLAARAGATLARLRPVQERVYIAVNREGTLRGNLAEIERALRALPAAPVILRETESDGERSGGVKILSLFSAVLRIAMRSYRVATSRVVIVDDYFFPIYPVKKRRRHIIQVCTRAAHSSDWSSDSRIRMGC